MTTKPRLLIVEDEAAIRDGLIDVFVYHGFEVDSCANGAAGLEKALTGRGHRNLAEIKLARLGPDAGLVGAADLARR